MWRGSSAGNSALRTIWRPKGPGFYRLTVVDGQGRKASARVRIK